MEAGLEGWAFGKPLDERSDVPHPSSGGPLTGSVPPRPPILHLVIVHLLCARPLQGTEDAVVDDMGQPQALPGAVHRLREVSDRKTHGE